MGLTIHYSLQANPRTTADEARQLVEQLRQRALDLPYKEVGEIVDLAGDEANPDKAANDSPHHWLLIQASKYVCQADSYSRVSPTRLIAFSTWPAEGSEQANFGLAQYPAAIGSESRLGQPEQIESASAPWSWSSFCKT